MDGEQLYYTISQMSMGDKKIFIATLTEAQKLAYKRYGNRMRQAKYNEKPENKQKLSDHRKEYISKARKEKPEVFKEQNVKDVRAFREREQKKLNEINNKMNAVDTLTGAIKAMKARKEFKTLKDAKEKQAKTTAEDEFKKKRREYMRKYRAEQKKKSEAKK